MTQSPVGQSPHNCGGASRVHQTDGVHGVCWRLGEKEMVTGAAGAMYSITGAGATCSISGTGVCTGNTRCGRNGDLLLSLKRRPVRFLWRNVFYMDLVKKPSEISGLPHRECHLGFLERRNRSTDWQRLDPNPPIWCFLERRSFSTCSLPAPRLQRQL